MDFFKGFFGDEDKDKKASPAAPGARPVLRVVGASHPPLNAPLGTSPQQPSQQAAAQALPSPTLGSFVGLGLHRESVPFLLHSPCGSQTNPE